MFNKIDRYLIIAILIVGLVCLYFLFVNKKDTNDQSSLLVAMARKLNGGTADNQQEENKNESSKMQVKLSEEEEQQILSIADKICFGVELDELEKEFQKAFQKEITEELERSRQILSIIVNKFLEGKTEFTKFEQEYYDVNQQYIDEIVHSKRLFSSIISKITSGNNEFTEDELQFKQNYSKQIEQELARIQKGNDKFKGGNPPMAAGERLKIILSFFQDGVPKTVTDLARLYAEKTNTKMNKGNMSTIFGKLVKNHQLICLKAGKDNKVYHGLPEWFDGSKLKAEYKSKISA